MKANPKLLEVKARIDQHVGALERHLADVVSARGLCGKGVEHLIHTRNQARAHQMRIARLIAQTCGGQAERLVEGATERRNG